MNMSYRLPNFLIAGAMKSGTTSLYVYLSQHPSIFMSYPKEPRFFIADTDKNLSRDDPRYVHIQDHTVFTFEEYCALFENIPPRKTAIGESSVGYLYHYGEAIPKIRKHLGNPKIIIILRNPVDRALSSYMHLFRTYWETDSFERCLELEEVRKKWDILNHYKSAGLYHEQVKAYLDNFDKVRIYLYDDMVDDVLKLVKDVYGFLEIDENFTPDTKKKYNVSKSDKSSILGRFLNDYNHPLKKVLRPLLLKTVGKDNMLKFIRYIDDKNKTDAKLTVTMKPETRKELIDFFRVDVLKLQDFTGRDLTHWLEY